MRDLENRENFFRNPRRIPFECAGRLRYGLVQPYSDLVLVGGRERLVNYLRFDGRLRCVVNHGVGVLNADTVSAALLLHQPHELVVMFLTGPIALPFQNCANRGDTNRPSLDHPREGRFLCGARGCAATVVHHIDVVAGSQHLDRGPGDANFCPETGHDDVLATGGLNGFAEFRAVPRIHGSPFDYLLARENIEQLRPDVSTEALGLDRGKNGGHAKLFRRFRDESYPVDKCGTVDAFDSEQHLRLVIDKDNDTVFLRVELVVLGHEFLCFGFDWSHPKRLSV